MDIQREKNIDQIWALPSHKALTEEEHKPRLSQAAEQRAPPSPAPRGSSDNSRRGEQGAQNIAPVRIRQH